MTKKYCILILVVAAVTVGLRLPLLALRPMHTDEAVHAEKFKALLEEGQYQYDSNEYHGPTLNYFTLIPARLISARLITDIDEFTLRIVPVFFGVLLVLMTFLLAGGLGWSVVIVAAVLTAVSPAFVFYSRYYIQEMLLVCFTFGLIVCGYRYTKNRKITWMIAAGVFAGLMHATKETCVIAFASMFLAALFVFMTDHGKNTFQAVRKTVKLSHLFAGFTVAVIVSMMFYSAFFTDPAGILDSVRTYAAYLDRAAQNQLHDHPWYYYLDILTYFEGFEKLTWNEDFVVVFALLGFVFAVTGKFTSPINSGLIRFIAFYTLIMTLIYSAIPYKTPWCLLGFLHGMILLAAVGIIAFFRFMHYRLSRIIAIILVVVFGLLSPVLQTCLGNFRFYADPSNPYVYAHTTSDIFRMVRSIEEVSKTHPDGKNMYIQVICSGSDYWPLPWYLRFFPNISWQSRVDDSAPIAQVIIVSPGLESDLSRKLYEVPPPGQKDLYVPLFESFMELRPHVELRCFVAKDLWDKYQAKKK